MILGRVSVTTAEGVPFMSQSLQMLTDNALDVTQLSAAIAVICSQPDIGIQPEFSASALSVYVHMPPLTTIIRIKVKAIRPSS
jgi:hypothetical protein